MAGAAYHLCHALNKLGKDIQAVNLRANNNYFNYPTIANMRQYSADNCREIIDRSDVVVFHSAVRPYFQSLLAIDKEKLKSKKIFLYLHGTEARTMGEEICTQADEYFGVAKYTVLVSTPDLQELIPAAKWMPVCRSFSEMLAKYRLADRDRKSLRSFGVESKKVIFCHAPTAPEIKGTATFYKAITDVVQYLPYVEYVPIQNLSWEACLRAMSEADVYFDQCVLGSYGAAAVEASVFRMPVFCLLSRDVAETMGRESGVAQPFIQWSSDDDLRTQSYMLAEKPELREKFGQMSYDYCRKVHDEKPVAERFLRYVDEAP